MKVIACYGDSLVEGFPFSREYSWLAAAEEASGGRLRLINRGICGECADDIFYRLRHYPLEPEITHLLFQGGVNDIFQGRPLRFTVADFAKARDFAADKNLPLCFVLPWFIGEASVDTEIETLRLALEQHFSADAFFLDLEPCCAALNQKRQSLFIDTVHPTQATYAALGRYAAPLLVKWTGKA